MQHDRGVRFALLLLILCSCALPTRGVHVVSTPTYVAPPAPSSAPIAIPEARQLALDYARAQSGKPYCWGGAGPGCFDCSGLVSEAWQRAGITLPRTSEAIRGSLPEVSWLEARPGDILWWPGHVGLYAGEGRVLDAGRAGGQVRERPLWGLPRVLRPIAI